MFEAIKKIKSWDDFLEATKLSNLIHKKVEEEKEEKKTKKVIITILAIIGAVAAVAAIAYFVYRYLTPDYLEDFDDDLDDDFDDDFFDDEDAAVVAPAVEAKED